MGWVKLKNINGKTVFLRSEEIAGIEDSEAIGVGSFVTLRSGASYAVKADAVMVHRLAYLVAPKEEPTE